MTCTKETGAQNEILNKRQGKTMTVEHYVKVLKAGGTPFEGTVTLTRGKAIRLYCIDCSGGNIAEVRKCNIETCPLYPFRMRFRDTKRPRSVSFAKLN